MNHSVLKFDSNRAPGSIVVTKNNDSIAMIVKCQNNHSNVKLRKGEWFVIPTTCDEKLAEQIRSVPFGPYDTVKEHLTKMLTQGETI